MLLLEKHLHLYNITYLEKKDVDECAVRRSSLNEIMPSNNIITFLFVMVSRIDDWALRETTSI